MRNRRLTIAGLALIAAVGLTGCTPTHPATPAARPVAATQTPVTRADPTADPKAELAAAATRLSEQSMRVTVDLTGGARMSGVADPKTGKMKMSMTFGTGSGSGSGSGTGSVDIRKIGRSLWMKFAGSAAALDGLGAGKGSWIHLDTSALGKAGAFGMAGNEPTAEAATMMKAATNVRRTGDHRFAGVLDLTTSPALTGKVGAGPGATLRAVPFTATADAKGRLTEMRIDLSGVSPGSGVFTTTYSDFGTPVSVSAPPAADVQELPSRLKGILGGH